jgi:hypothetical protein
MIGQALQPGDQIIYTLDAKTSIVSIDSFVDSITGETVERYFDKQFSYAVEGLFFNDWQELNDNALQLIQTDLIRSYVFRVRYIRQGSDTTGELILNSIQINTTNFTIDDQLEWKNSNFTKFFTTIDHECINWTLNVLKKIYQPGELAIFIERGKILDQSELPGFRIIEDGSYRLLEDGSLRLYR